MKTHTFARKPFYVEAVRVTDKNIEEVAEWCGGELGLAEPNRRYIRVSNVSRPLNDRQRQAFVGDWVLRAGNGFKIYTAKAFDRSFEKVRTLTKAQADQAGIRPPIEKRSESPVTIEPVPQSEV